MDDWLRTHRDQVREDYTREFNGVTVLLLEVAIDPAEGDADQPMESGAGD